MKKTLTYNRFGEFLDEVKNAKNDEEILMAGHNLLEKWQGYRYQKNADAGLKAIQLLIKLKPKR
jgi:hypothetical protein